MIKGGVVSLLLIGTQAYWVSKSFDTRTMGFDHSVSVALYSVADTMSEHATVEKRATNYYYVQTNSPLSNQKVQELVHKEFSARNIELDYELGVYDAEDDTLVYGHRVSASEPYVPPNLCEDTTGANMNFAVFFPTKAGILSKGPDIWALLVSLVIVCSWLYANTTSARAARLAQVRHRIMVGQSCLDFHNQQLTVNQQTYPLTYKENLILKLLFERPNEVIDREIFLKEVWGKDGFFVARSMDVFISRVRKYLKDDVNLKIENLRAIGYRLHVKK